MKVTVDRETCQAHGQCAFVAPDIFVLDDDGELHYREDVPDAELEAAREAAAFCPTAAISIGPS